MVINGALAGSEIAVVSVRKTRLDELVNEAKAGAHALRRLRARPESFLATVQIGITVVGTAAGALGGHSVSEKVEPYIARVPMLKNSADEIALVLVIVVLVFLELVVGELVPKSLALRAAESFSLIMSRPLLFLSYVFRPVVWLLTASSNLVLRVFNDETSFSEARLSPGEIQQMVDEAAEAGSMDKQAGEIASRAIDFADLTADQIMVPRQKVVGIPRGASPDEIRQLVLEHGKTRMPVYEDMPDNVVGYVTLRDLMALLFEQHLLVLEDTIRPAFKVAESMRAVDLLTEMRSRRIQLAIVTDASGAMAGIVTVEDLVEELVGEIASEHDAHEPHPIQREANGKSAIARGDVPIREVNRELELNLEEGETWTTIAGLCLELAGRIPAVGQSFKAADGTTLEIVAASPRQVTRVRVIPKEPVEDDA